MLLADALPETWIQLAAIVATALVGAWTTVRVRTIDRQAKRERRRAAVEKARCDALEVRVGELEQRLERCLHSKKPRRPRPRK